jgi:hypothetical protein
MLIYSSLDARHIADGRSVGSTKFALKKLSFQILTPQLLGHYCLFCVLHSQHQSHTMRNHHSSLERALSSLTVVWRLAITLWARHYHSKSQYTLSRAKVRFYQIVRQILSVVCGETENQSQSRTQTRFSMIDDASKGSKLVSVTSDAIFLLMEGDDLFVRPQH